MEYLGYLALFVFVFTLLVDIGYLVRFLKAYAQDMNMQMTYKDRMEFCLSFAYTITYIILLF